MVVLKNCNRLWVQELAIHGSQSFAFPPTQAVSCPSSPRRLPEEEEFQCQQLRTARTGPYLPEDAGRTLGGAPLTLLVNCTPPSRSATSGSWLVRTTTLQQAFTTVTSQHMRSWHLFLFLTTPHLPHYNRSATRCFNCFQHSVLFPSPPEKCPVYITGPGLMLPCR